MVNTQSTEEFVLLAFHSTWLLMYQSHDELVTQYPNSLNDEKLQRFKFHTEFYRFINSVKNFLDFMQIKSRQKLETVQFARLTSIHSSIRGLVANRAETDTVWRYSRARCCLRNESETSEKKLFREDNWVKRSVSFHDDLRITFHRFSIRSSLPFTCHTNSLTRTLVNVSNSNRKLRFLAWIGKWKFTHWRQTEENLRKTRQRRFIQIELVQLFNRFFYHRPQIKYKMHLKRFPRARVFNNFPSRRKLCN